MPRRTRTRQARRAEARARQEREEAYAELEEVLHRESQERPVASSRTARTGLIKPDGGPAEPETAAE